ncbi:hypothetical protein M752DRAFT_2025 [Aspergillus phoenicis ATCC 13157]|uniref:Uncharacterized protein n=1 Tax=Aspergillus phoenicis ATCC 13157 TaxID=1353007 RepID=A0A370PZ84_ASPPH|nr:hypothetical protein M752DRAFT_2025 [Aspergillus phoenicis ATCC 13157]
MPNKCIGRESGCLWYLYDGNIRRRFSKNLTNCFCCRLGLFSFVPLRFSGGLHGYIFVLFYIIHCMLGIACIPHFLLFQSGSCP